jgi:hypothetical protein
VMTINAATCSLETEHRFTGYQDLLQKH